MSVFDLLFLIAALASAVALATVAFFALRGQPARALQIFCGFVLGAAAYLAVGVAAAFYEPQKVMSTGTPWCFDDWCLTVEKVTTVRGSDQVPDLQIQNQQVSYNIDLRIESRARRVAQRASGAWIYLIDDRGRLYPPEATPSSVPLDVQLQPGESFTTSRMFVVPENVRKLGLITGHGGYYCGAMDALIIGRGGCWFKKPAMIRIQ